jgi:phospholipid/cholesterol/gamma-HCH transport system permease protein
MFLDSERAGDTLTLRPRGRWLIDNAAALAAAFDALDTAARPGPQSVLVDPAGLEALDLSGGWLLHARLQAFQQQGAQVHWQGGGPPDQIRFIEKTLAAGSAAGSAADSPAVAPDSGVDFVAPLRALGRWTAEQALTSRDTLAFFGRFCVAFGGALVSLRRLRLPAVVRQVYETGVQAIPIVALIALLISVIIAYMGASELRKFGAEIFVVDLVTVGVLRELGVLLTAIIVAGRSGSAFAAEIGVMKLNDEVDALKAIGTNPVEVLVMPRVLGLVIALPLLTMIADAVGLAGGCLLTYVLLDMPPQQYFARVQEAIAPTTFWVGMMKAPVFAFLIAFIGTLRGMQVRDSSRELGRLTTVAVVQSIFLVILADAVFAMIFLELDI